VGALSMAGGGAWRGGAGLQRRGRKDDARVANAGSRRRACWRGVRRALDEARRRRAREDGGTRSREREKKRRSRGRAPGPGSGGARVSSEEEAVWRTSG
jgi:hypothetical protein